jgi:N-acetylglucosaminyl-diphospho-decaprenol L-rhamnosyltransferase
MASGKPAERGIVDVVIPTYDARDVVIECLEHLEGDDAIAARIVVDDVSSDDTGAAVRDRFEDVRVLELEEHRGLAHALNAGASLGDAPYVLFMNNDLIAEPGAVGRLAEALAADPEAVSAGPRLIDAGTGATQDGYRPRDYPTLATLVVRWLGIERLWRANPWSGGHIRSRLGDDEVTRVDRQPAGACLLVDRDAYERIGGWDEGYWFWYEDVDFSLRLGALGPALWVGTATLLHEGMHSTSSWPKHEQHRRLYLGTLRYAQQHLRRWQSLLVAVLMLLTCLPRWLAAALLRRPSRSVYTALIRASASAALGRETFARIPAEASRRRKAAGPAPAELRSE